MKVFLALNRTTLIRSGATLRRSIEESSQCRDVGIQRHDVPESGKNQCRDVPERCKTNVAMLRSHVMTFQRGLKPTSRRSEEGSNLTLRR